MKKRVVPPLAEQHRIVAKVNQLMALCDAAQALLEQRAQLQDELCATALPTLELTSSSPEEQAGKQLTLPLA